MHCEERSEVLCHHVPIVVVAKSSFTKRHFPKYYYEKADAKVKGIHQFRHITFIRSLVHASDFRGEILNSTSLKAEQCPSVVRMTKVDKC
jgi:hypothetical protein